MTEFSGVTMDGEDSASSRRCSTSASVPSMQRSASSREALASRRIDSSRLRAITGICTLSSKLPEAPAQAIAASLPTTWEHTCRVASGITGLTLPGMIDEPGCRSGRRSSPSPVRGPEPIQRRSLQILVSETAMVRSAPEASTRASRLAWASMWSTASRSTSSPVDSRSAATTAAPKPSGALSPVPTAVPPMASSPSRGSVACTRSTPASTWRA